MNYFDIIVIIILCYAVYKGFKKGLVFELAGLVALILGIWGAVHFSSYTAEQLHPHLNLSPRLLFYLAFAITFIIIAVAIFFIAKLIEKMVNALALGWANKLGGILFSTAKIFLIISILIFFLNGINARFQFISSKTTEESVFYTPLSDLSDILVPKVMYLKLDSIKDSYDPYDSIKP